MWGDTAHDTESNIKCDISSSNAHYININVVGVQYITFYLIPYWIIFLNSVLWCIRIFYLFF